MSWDSDFYSAAMSNASYSSGINSLALEYKADAVAPYSNYQLIAASGDGDLDGATDEGERLIQLSTWAATPTLAKQLAEYAIIGVRDTFTDNLISVFQRSMGGDPDEELFGYAVDFLIWFETP